MSIRKESPNEATQKFNVREWIKSEQENLNTVRALAELIDNAIDETPTGQRCEVAIDLDRHGRKIVITNKNTSGMGPDKMREFLLWGGRHQDAQKIKEHRLGGKLSVLYLLSEENGNLSIASQPAGSDISYHLDINDWWNNLEHDITFPITQVRMPQREEQGKTRLLMEGINPNRIPANISGLADELGLIYGKIIEEGRLDVHLQLESSSGKKIQRADVLPVSVPFKEDVKIQDRVYTGKGSPRIQVKWGLINQDRKQQEEAIRKNLYATDRVLQIKGNTIYIYYYGRLLQTIPVSSLGIPGSVDRLSLAPFAAVVDVTEGIAPKTIVKDALSYSAQETRNILDATRKLVEEDVIMLVKETPAREIPTKYGKAVTDTNVIFTTVLNSLFQNNISQIAETFGLPTQGAVIINEAKEGDESENPMAETRKRGTPTLPGSRSGSSSTSSSTKEPTSPSPSKGRPTGEKTFWINPIPDFRVVNFGQDFPQAHLTLDSETGRAVIEFNHDNPHIQSVLEHNKTSRTTQLFIAAWELYKEYWGKVYKDNSKEYEEAMQKDVSGFIEEAKRLKLI